MAEGKRKNEPGGGLEFDQDLGHARTLWRVQRAGWAVMALIILGALLGVFGRGPLAHASAESGALRVEYDRIARHGSSSRLRAEVAPAVRRGDTIRVWVDRAFLEGVEIEAVTPEPVQVETRGDALWFTFLAPDSVRTALISLQLRPDDFGSRRGRVGVEGGGAVAFRQLVLP